MKFGADQADHNLRNSGWIRLTTFFVVLGLAFGAQQGHVKRGYELAEKGEFRAAEAELRQALEIAPNDAVAHAVLGMVLTGEKKFGEANVHFGRALELDPSDIGTRYNLAVNQSQLGQFAAARENLERILKTQPGHAPATLLLARVLGSLGEHRAVLTLLEPLTSQSRDPQVHRLLARAYQRLSRPADALRAMSRVVELDPSTEASYDDLAALLLEQKRYSDAYEVARRMAEKLPNSALAYKRRGQAEGYVRSLRASLDSLLRSVELNPDDSEALLLVGYTQARLSLISEAAATFEKAIARFPRDARCYESYGRMLLQPSSRLDAAAEARAGSLLERALELDPTLPGAHYELGRLLLKHDKPAEALPHLEAASRLNPHSGEIFFTLAGAYRALGRDPDSRKALEVYRSLQASP